MAAFNTPTRQTDGFQLPVPACRRASRSPRARRIHARAHVLRCASFQMLTKLSPRCPRQGKASLWLAAEASCSSSCCHNSTSRSARSTTRQVHRLLLATRTWRGHQGIQTLGRFFERRRYAGCHLSLAYATSPSADKHNALAFFKVAVPSRPLFDVVRFKSRTGSVL